ncbi:ICOS ligand-like [Oreochromis aureus]|uniref:ICOS ligand-like n=1 Tax=Oreochromis aureus TaxID=47969 RepID=UPI001952C57D|nr:ICOS ligand-like [Oreochromis aureus]
MDFVPRLSLWWIFFGYLCFAASGAEPYQKNIAADSGQDVILPCQAQNYNKENFQWNRTDLGDEEYVFLHRDNLSVLENQHSSFKNRVDLQDRQMKDGALSLILKNVTTNDTGTYECGVFINGTNDPISIISLSVDPPGQTGGHTEDGGKEDGSVGLIAGPSLSAVCGVFSIYRKQTTSLPLRCSQFEMSEFSQLKSKVSCCSSEFTLLSVAHLWWPHMGAQLTHMNLTTGQET